MDKFKVLKQLGDGAFGSVCMAQNSSNGDIVAIKKMKQKFATWEQCTQLRELKSLAKLNNHANIVKLKEVIRDQATEELNFVFEYMETNLHQRIKEREGRPFPEEDIKNMTFQLLSGLAHMHKHGFFHRDLKPENLLISGSTVKIADFGLARETRSLPPYTEYVSTRWYRAPEVILKTHNYSSPIDIWAVGTIIAELVLLYPLFPGTSEVDQLHRICTVLGNPATSGDGGSVGGAGGTGGMVGAGLMRVMTPQARESVGGGFGDLGGIGRPQTSHSPLLSKNTVGVSATGSGNVGLSRDKVVGGGPWIEGLKLAAAMGFKFPNVVPFHYLTSNGVASTEIIVLIADMLLFDPNRRLTANEALQQPWFRNQPGVQVLQRSTSFQKPETTNPAPTNTKNMVSDVTRGLSLSSNYSGAYGRSTADVQSKPGKSSSDSFDFLSDDDEDDAGETTVASRPTTFSPSQQLSPRQSDAIVGGSSSSYHYQQKAMPYDLKEALQKRKPDSDASLMSLGNGGGSGSGRNSLTSGGGLGLGGSGFGSIGAKDDKGGIQQQEPELMHTTTATVLPSSSKFELGSPPLPFHPRKVGNAAGGAGMHANSVARDSILEWGGGGVPRLKGSLSNSDLLLGSLIPSLNGGLEGTSGGSSTREGTSNAAGLRKQYRPLPEIGKSNTGSLGSLGSCANLAGEEATMIEKKRPILPSVLGSLRK
ncbi:Pkinase-domain-containing protein [Rhizoclosmatium globosum]|uniref:Pkinase-domain-containing protein n=1 Tax=Rhizoclosmatium globosum TaxID=329046 RepID=A0A1Y2CMM5_9FUNG|nr:Pkinase-domain-containing protein [Rhizoclosmatium globosum]|eukprot:ORY48207.1 Pkinase-domain-containing protein [Rhizoclosmatium globosum]